MTDVPGLPTAVTAAGFDAPSGQLSVTAHITAPKAERDRLTGIGDTTVALYDFALPVGDVDTVRVNGLRVPTSSFVSSADGATCSASAAGNNAAFNAPAAGVHVVSPPSAFTLRASSTDGLGADTSCNLKVVAANEIPGGKIIATIGTKRVAKGLLDAKGKLALTLKPKVFKVGSNKVKIKYLGNGYMTPSRTKVCVKLTA